MSHAMHREDPQSEHGDEQQLPEGTSRAHAPAHPHTGLLNCNGRVDISRSDSTQ
jgi:hypothetical protein